jgi:nitroimidazol reductase NimA-like FMN-containing flavoprotein (pyridoxamine 5'-phosphate oxidase superfamily)
VQLRYRRGGDVRELEVSECWSRLRTSDVGRIAVYSEADGVDIFPVNHVVDGGTVVFRTADGTKLSSIEDGYAAAFEVDGTDKDDHAWSVVVKGTAHVILRREELFDIFDLDVRPWHDGDKPCFVRISPVLVTGRDFAVSASRLQGEDRLEEGNA